MLNKKIPAGREFFYATIELCDGFTSVTNKYQFNRKSFTAILLTRNNFICYNLCSETVEDPCRKGLSFMYYLIHPEADVLLDRMSPEDMVIYDDVRRRLDWWDELKKSKYTDGVEHIDDYVLYPVDLIADKSWTDDDYVVATLKDFEIIDTLVIDADGKRKVYVKLKED